MTSALIWLWLGPFTLLGLLVALLGGVRSVRVESGAMHFVAAPRWVLGWFFRAFGVAAFTWGAVIIFANEWGPRNTRLVRHEQAHVCQASTWGPVFPVAYMLASAWALVRGGHVYRDNWFERAARAA